MTGVTRECNRSAGGRTVGRLRQNAYARTLADARLL